MPWRSFGLGKNGQSLLSYSPQQGVGRKTSPSSSRTQQCEAMRRVGWMPYRACCTVAPGGEDRTLDADSAVLFRLAAAINMRGCTVITTECEQSKRPKNCKCR